MQLLKLAAAAALTLSSLAIPVASADAQRGWHGDRGHHNGMRNHRPRRVCTWTWRHHHRVRVCTWRRW
jgi:Spy/CpxP family protein refolding chaperone